VAEADFSTEIDRWLGAADGSARERLAALAAYFKANGTYTDGGPGSEQYPAGHSVFRLKMFSEDGGQLAGNDEQYAATLALAANQMGVPARVVVGAKVPEGNVIKGQHVEAWVEVRNANGQWEILAREDFMSRRRPQENAPQPLAQVAGEAVPPPAPVRPPSTSEEAVPDLDNRKSTEEDGPLLSGTLGLILRIVAWVASPFVLFLAGAAAIAGIKARRRGWRRSRGSPSTRLAKAWRESLDLARDHGLRVYDRQTRREQARAIGLPPYAALARRLDAEIFGRREPDDEVAAASWAQVDALRKELVSGLNRRQRLRAAMSLASLRPLPRTEVNS